IIYWNGRNDSLWSQIIAVTESFVSMNSNRLKVAWRVADKYESQYNSVFTDHLLPAPFVGGSAAYKALYSIQPDGQCQTPCSGGCTQFTNVTGGTALCWPPVPLQGKPGAKAGCQAGDPTEPFLDAYDCALTDAQNRTDATRIYVDFAKAI